MSEEKMEQSHENKNNKRNKIIAMSGVFLLLFSLLFLLVATLATTDEKNKKEINQKSSQDIDSKENKKDIIFSDDKKGVQVGNVAWLVAMAENKGNILKAIESKSKIKDKEASQDAKYIGVLFSVMNLGKEMKSLTVPSVVDDQGRIYSPSSDTFDWILDEYEIVGFTNINPSIKKTYYSIYEIPNEAKGLKLKVGDLKISENKEAEIELGL